MFQKAVMNQEFHMPTESIIPVVAILALFLSFMAILGWGTLRAAK